MDADDTLPIDLSAGWIYSCRCTGDRSNCLGTRCRCPAAGAEEDKSSGLGHGLGGDKLSQCTKAQAQYGPVLPLMWLMHSCQSGRAFNSSIHERHQHVHGAKLCLRSSPTMQMRIMTSRSSLPATTFCSGTMPLPMRDLTMCNVLKYLSTTTMRHQTLQTCSVIEQLL